jgi:hypothetical protein
MTSFTAYQSRRGCSCAEGSDRTGFVGFRVMRLSKKWQFAHSNLQLAAVIIVTFWGLVSTWPTKYAGILTYMRKLVTGKLIDNLMFDSTNGNAKF